MSRRLFPRHYYLVYNSPPLNCDLNRINPVYARKSSFTITTLSRLGFPNGLFNFSDKNFVSVLNLSLARYAHIWWSVQILKVFFYTVFSGLYSLPRVSGSTCNSQHWITKFSCSGRYQGFRPYEVKIIILCFIISRFLDWQGEKKYYDLNGSRTLPY